LTQISRRATFSPQDTTDRILEDLSCPACGRLDLDFPLAPAHGRLAANKLRIFCEGCGAFVTISMSDAQASTILDIGRATLESRRPSLR
jgi:hypothetical protein